MKDFKIFVMAGFTMLLVFFAFTGFTATHFHVQPANTWTPGNLDPQVVEFLQYLIASITGIAAVLLRKVIARWLGPGWDEKKNHHRY